MPVVATKGASNSDLPAEDFFAVTPSDTDELRSETRYLIVGTAAGTVHVTKLNGVEETFTLPVGCFKLRCKKVWATGTTATGITAAV